nr:ribonuclease H-like domain, Gag-pre-integrase domain protein [Tanacetum cinerariifolium]
MVTIDGEGVDWTGHAKDDTTNYALMAFNSSNLGSNTEVTSCSKVCEESYAKLKKLYNEQKEQLDVDSLEIQAYILALKKSSDVEDSHVNDKFSKVKGMHAVPPLMMENYVPPKSDFAIDESKFTYGPKQFTTSETDAKTSDLDSCESSSSEETLETVPELVESKPKVVNKPNVWSYASIIKDYESDSDDEHVTIPSKELEKPSFAFVNTVKHVQPHRKTAKEQNTCSLNPKPSKRDWNGLMSKKLGLGYGFTKKACFVCGSFSHLIKDYDFHEKRMAKQVALNKGKNKIIIANVPPNDPNVDAYAIVPTPVNLDHAPAQPIGLGNDFAPYWIGGNIPNNQNGWIEEDA